MDNILYKVEQKKWLATLTILSMLMMTTFLFLIFSLIHYFENRFAHKFTSDIERAIPAIEPLSDRIFNLIFVDGFWVSVTLIVISWILGILLIIKARYQHLEITKDEVRTMYGEEVGKSMLVKDVIYVEGETRSGGSMGDSNNMSRFLWVIKDSNGNKIALDRLAYKGELKDAMEYLKSNIPNEKEHD